MATFLDVGFLERFMPIFVLILVFAIIYALLNLTNAVGDNKNIQAIVSIIIAILAIISKKITLWFSLFFPWMVLFLVFMVFLIAAFRMFGGTEIKFPIPKQTWGWIIFIVLMVIIISSLVPIMGPQALTYTEGDTSVTVQKNTTEAAPVRGESDTVEQRTGSAIFHPTMLGFILVILVAAIGIGSLTAVPKPPE